MDEVTRREFVKGTATVAAGAALGIGALKRSTAAWAGANDRIRMAVIGIKGRGQSHLDGFSGQQNVEVATMCDIDERLFEPRAKDHFDAKNLKRPKFETDLRRVMEDKSIDAVSIATPNHWHSLAAIWACQAGKDVYVEKPLSHNIHEGRMLVEAARKYDRIVQHGTQSRTSPAIREGIQKLREGIIGEVYYAKGMCYKWRETIGKTPETAVPAGVHYDIWLGPAPERAFTENRFHYNWHWHWDYGNGDMGNQGVHQMDLTRWGLGVELPSKVASVGGHFMFDDDQETPNTIISSYFYPEEGKKGKMLVFETRHWITNHEAELGKGADNEIGNLFLGSNGYMTMDGSGYTTYIGKDRTPGPSASQAADHFANFIEAVRSRKRETLNAEAEEGHYSAALCHLGNISYRLGRSLDFDPKQEKFVSDAEANAMLSRNYRAPFVVPATV
jgi:predicted dehydrogenase